MKLLPCTRELLEGIKAPDVVGQPSTNVGDWYTDEEMAQLARAYVHKGTPIAAMGVVPVLPRVATAWAVLSEESTEEHGPVLCMGARRGLEMVQRLGRFTRIDMLVRKDFKVGKEWAEWLGFEIEGTKKNYGSDGRTTFHEYVMYLDPVDDKIDSWEDARCNSYPQ
jgi:hypothetical protein